MSKANIKGQLEKQLTLANLNARTSIMIKSAKEFIQLIDNQSDNSTYRATTEEATEQVWADVSEHPEYEKYILQNITISNRTIKSLSKSPNSLARWWVAQKRRTGNDVLKILPQDKDSSVRQAVAANKKNPYKVLE